MSAPSTEAAPRSEQPTQPLPRLLHLPSRHGAFKESGLWLFPGAPIAAFVVGIPLHELWIYTEAAMFAFAALALGFLLLTSVTVFLFARAVGRGKDGRA